jgi:AcrR family transcriptional regulator
VIGDISIAESQRGRMLAAMSSAVAEKSYARTTVADVVRIAGVSRRTFYEQFADKEACFLAAYEAGAQEVIVRILDAESAEHGGDWRGRARIALETYTESLAAEPEFARVFIIDVLGCGDRAVELRQRGHDMFIEQFRLLAALAAEEDPAIGPIPDLALTALVGGISEIVQRHIVSEGAETLPTLAPALGELAIQVIERAGATIPVPR